MIVEPDFLEHWKTRLLVRLLGTEEAPLYVIRLWAHCQHRKTDRFTDWNPDVLASVCRWDGPVDVFWAAMTKTFVDVEGDNVIAHDWNVANASLLSAWENGKKGGRPSKKPRKKPAENPSVIQQDTGRLTDREDREDREEKIPADVPASSVNPPEPPSPWIVDFGLELPESLRTNNCLDAIRTWLAYKRERKQGYKPQGLKGALTAFSKQFTPATFPSAVERSIANNWSGLFPENPKPNGKPAPKPIDATMSDEEKTRLFRLGLL
jgi:hypothetical protein